MLIRQMDMEGTASLKNLKNNELIRTKQHKNNKKASFQALNLIWEN